MIIMQKLREALFILLLNKTIYVSILHKTIIVSIKKIGEQNNAFFTLKKKMELCYALLLKTVLPQET